MYVESNQNVTWKNKYYRHFVITYRREDDSGKAYLGSPRFSHVTARR